MGTQGRRRLSGVGRGASVSLTANRRKQLSGMEILFQNLLQTVAQHLDAVAQRTGFSASS